MRKKILSIIIPVYNEKKFIKPLLLRVANEVVSGYEKEIIIIDDGSTDGTTRILKKTVLSLKKDTDGKIVLIVKKNNQGKGSAIKEGLKNVTGDVIIIQDADLEYNPKDYKYLIRPIELGKSKVVYGSRTLGINNDYHNTYSSLFHYYGGQLLTYYMNVLYEINITDQPTGYKVFSKEVLEVLKENIHEDDFSSEIEITAALAKNKYNISEVPISYSPRSIIDGKKIGPADFFKAILVGLRCKFT